jgi:hypothetical protein
LQSKHWLSKWIGLLKNHLNEFHVRLSSVGHPNLLKPVANPYHRYAPFSCSYPWYALKILDPSQRLYPCSFIHHIKGHEDVGLQGSSDFGQLWNSPAMVHLRRTLEEGELLPECITCPSQMGGEGQCQSD